MDDLSWGSRLDADHPENGVLIPRLITRWTTTPAGLDDLDVDQTVVDEAVSEVEAGFEDNTAQGDWQAETALQDAHDYVDAYLLDDESVDEDLRDSVSDFPQVRLAVDLAVRDVILAAIAEREAA